MRAKDYIEYYRQNLKFVDGVKGTLDRFADFRNNLSKTNRHFKQLIENADKWVSFMDKCLKIKVKPENHWEFMQNLENAVATDVSFVYLYHCINKTDILTSEVTTSASIDTQIANQYEDYPKEYIDDYLTNKTNAAFVETIEKRNYTESQELDIYNSAYRLFDEIRQQLQKPKHASHIYKEYKGETEQITDDTLRLLSIFAHDYNYDFSPEQKEKLNQIADQLGKFIRQRNNQKTANSEAHEKWDILLETVENMVSDFEKIKMLLTEKTRFLQLSLTEQQRIDAHFAEKCQLEIDKIQQIRSLMVNVDEESSKTTKTNTKRTFKVTSDVLLLLLQKLGVSAISDDKAKMARLISYLTGFSEEKIRQRLSNTDELTSYHKEEVETVNKILNELNFDISIEYNKDR